ncbi:2,4-diaminobutyrate decarboxylase [Bacillus sp. SA1-12]|uniref:pyridoxal phosphate-dependent decarboxylase family protein n=1 Tax=Bacillus sp. SA1-12 TaxID=1455638 RepID=UPI000625DD02|nr:aspartate aminotransferase family protein [Bacillus sp. SA1-12]KKI94043.1 2,4-diaminobutyrate decarboxylase [Bacillus sp. SA1-12]
MKNEFQQWFLNSSEESQQLFMDLMVRTVKLLIEETNRATNPYSGAIRKDIEARVKEITNITTGGQKTEAVLTEIQKTVVRNSLWISNPAAMAHLHCPPLLPAIAAEVLISTLNQSMDSWDQSPSATYVEEEVLQYFIKKIGFTEHADGVFTSGGTQSNYMGLLLARNQACQRHFSINVQEQGLPSDAGRLRILCSEHAHFTVQQSAAQLGLGIQSVVTIKTNEKNQICLKDAQQKLAELHAQGLLPFMIVATAGTTDFGSIDNLTEIAMLAHDYQLWLHVDAAYGGALLFSQQYRDLLHDLSLADSITIDFHKLYYQSISCGAFFVRDRKSFRHIAYHAEYLNPEEDRKDGIINLVEKSVQTTKRFDALKVLMTFKLIGTEVFGNMIDSTIQLAKNTAELFQRSSQFEVLNEPVINAVLFRYLPDRHAEDHLFVDEINLELQRYFYQSGELIMAKTRQNGKVFLKFTMLNPLNTLRNMEVQIENMKKIGEIITKKKGERSNEYSVHF